MSSMRLLKLIGTIDDDLITEALEYKGKAVTQPIAEPVTKPVPKRSNGRTRTIVISLLSAAACVALFIGVMMFKPSKSAETKEVDTHNGATNQVLAEIGSDTLGGSDSTKESPSWFWDSSDEEEEETVAAVEDNFAEEADDRNIDSKDATDGGYNLTPDTPVTKLSLQINSIADGTIKVSYVLSDSNYADEFYTYEDLYRIVKTDSTYGVDYSSIQSPDKEPDENSVKVPLDQTTNTMTFNYEEKYGELEPGTYLFVGYIYSNNGNGTPFWQTAEIIIPRT